ncbi:hypothetical protein GF376_01835 [Candidatus Peregrinibacteria bacterium]|nr:hypothetical protein [Candidatus Peregrinibacteria bacterium]
MRIIYKIIALLSLIGILTLAFVDFIPSNQKNTQTTILTEQGEQKVDIKQYYNPADDIKTAILGLERSTDRNLDRKNMQIAVHTLFKNLPENREFDNIILLMDPDYPDTYPDLFTPEISSRYPNIEINLIQTEGDQTETRIYQEIMNHKQQNSLIILQLYYKTEKSNPLIQEIQDQHFKNAFDNFNKASLTSLPFTNTEALKAVYQVNKDAGNLKTLPTLNDQDRNFFIKFVVPGNRFESEIVTITFIGDIMLGRFVHTLMQRHGMDYPFEKMDQNYLRVNDLLIGNLEGPISTTEFHSPTALIFRFVPEVAPLLKKYHFDGLSLANNHALDMREKGFNETINFLEKVGITAFGHPKSETERVWKTKINGRKMAFVGFQDVTYKLDYQKATETVAKLSEEGYQVIPFVHWGSEYNQRPRDYKVKFAHDLVDAGAIAIVGHHPHVVQSFEIYNNRPIFYSIGNAIFDQYFSREVQEGLAPTIVIKKDSMDIYFIPIKIERSQLRLMDQQERNEFLKRFSELWRYDQETKEEIIKGKITVSFDKTQPNL